MGSICGVGSFCALVVIGNLGVTKRFVSIDYTEVKSLNSINIGGLNSRKRMWVFERFTEWVHLDQEKSSSSRGTIVEYLTTLGC